MIKVDKIERIRRAYYVEGKSMRQIAREYHHSWHTVKKALASAEAGGYSHDRSVYPFAAVSLGGSYGLAMGYDIDAGPRDVQFVYSTHSGESFTSIFRLGLSDAPTRFPRQAGFRMVLHRTEGTNPFRSASIVTTA